MKKSILGLMLGLFACCVHAQNNVGIGTPNPDPSAILELQASDKGILIPRMNAVQRTSIATPKDGLMVYDTDSSCFFYYQAANAQWGSLCQSGGGQAWLLKGNGGTNPATNFIGTTDNKDFVASTNAKERMRITSTGAISVNKPAPRSGIVFSSYGSNAAGKISTIGDTAIAGFSGTDNGVGVYGENKGGRGPGVCGISNGPVSAGVYGDNISKINTSQTQGAGVYGTCTGFISFRIGVMGEVMGPHPYGVIGVSGDSAGVVISGKGAGGSFTGEDFGTFAITRDSNGPAVLGACYKPGSSLAYILRGTGVQGIGRQYGVIGLAARSFNTDGTKSTNALGSEAAAAGGYFEVDNGNTSISWAYVSALDLSPAGTLRKIIGNGTVNTIVKDTADKLIALSCPEAPENLFQDLGKGTLQSGKAHITLDPNFAKNIIVDSKHDLRVFVQMKGDCKGVYVTNENQYGFDVVELSGGASNASFTWMVMANRADEVLADGHVSRYSDERFAPAPGPEVKTTAKIGLLQNSIGSKNIR